MVSASHSLTSGTGTHDGPNAGIVAPMADLSTTLLLVTCAAHTDTPTPTHTHTHVMRRAGLYMDGSLTSTATP